MKCVHEHVEEQALARPGALALVAGAERLTYAGLDRRAAEFAALLVARGVRPGDTVGVRLERSAALVAAVLGVLKAGAAYVVLDPAFPAARLSAMAADAGVTAVVAPRGTPLDGVAGQPVHPEDSADLAPLPHGAVPVDPAAPACVMFTSGSTGRPKGAAAPHHAITATLTGQDFASFGPGAVWLQCAPLSWDAFALELWGPLVNGGTCVLHPPGRPEPLEMSRLVAEHGVTSMYLSSSLFNVVVDEYPDLLDGPAELIVGGEALSPPHVARALARRPGLRLSNGYGPVECMVFLTTHRVTGADLASGGPLPIGRPLAGKRLYVLDEDLRPVPDGATGELYAAGAGLAREYTGRPALTAERFVAGPGGERLYRTGDLVRRRADGVLEHLGRADSQVKIRGFRVEPGEIEAVLAGHPDVDRAAVAVHPHPAGDRQLTAYVVPRTAPAPLAAALRAYAAALLPEHLVPAAFVALDALPLTPSGKLDRAALPAPGTAASPDATGADGTADPTTAALCALFSEVLGVPAGADDDFFVRGGNSLLAARLTGRIRSALGVEIDIRTLFEAPTPARLAPLADRAPAAVRRPAPATPAGPLPVSDAQQRLWFLDRTGAGAAYNLPMLVRLRGPVDPDALAGALADVAGRHEVLRTLFGESDGVPVRRVRTGNRARPPFAHEVVGEAELTARVELAARHRFDLAAELPFRAVLFTLRERPGEHALLVLVHHIAGDGWSLRPLFRDLSHAYAARTGGGAAALPRLPVPYAEHARRRVAGLGRPTDPGSPAARQLAYWKERLTGLDADGPLLPRRPGAPAAPGPDAGVVVRRLDAAAHARIEEAARARGATLFMALHTALLTALLAAGAGPDTAIGAPVAARAADTDVEDVVGFFVNLLVLRVDASGDPGPAGLLARVRDADLGALAHQDVPFEQVVGALNPARRPGRQPFTEVVLALQNNARAEVALPGAEGGVELVRTGSARFDLLVDVSEDTGTDGTPGGLTLTFEYRTGALEEPFVSWLADTLPRALAALADAPDTPLSALGLPEPPRRADDRDRLPAAVRPAPAAAGSPAEEAIGAVWREVLGVAQVGRDDDFFALGGNSLRAVRVAARLSTPGRPVTAAQLFATPTVATLSAELESAAGQARPAAAPIPRAPRIPRGVAPTPQPAAVRRGSRNQEDRQWTSV
ncbi:non-ribosomal peptide synthetase [Streptomyces sp. CB02460]|uniref:non-ribosomal peptide synthetase n=1 Tax=Streptomyces sp. CB02460 TaxID=1703941 RepID=UPI0009401E69|nr:non-ribosomal peptide synthetase [Streptomyces sp. CB02460]